MDGASWVGANAEGSKGGQRAVLRSPERLLSSTGLARVLINKEKKSSALTSLILRSLAHGSSKVVAHQWYCSLATTSSTLGILYHVPREEPNSNYGATSWRMQGLLHDWQVAGRRRAREDQDGYQRFWIMLLSGAEEGRACSYLTDSEEQQELMHLLCLRSALLCQQSMCEGFLRWCILCWRRMPTTTARFGPRARFQYPDLVPSSTAWPRPNSPRKTYDERTVCFFLSFFPLCYPPTEPVFVSADFDLDDAVSKRTSRLADGVLLPDTTRNLLDGGGDLATLAYIVSEAYVLAQEELAAGSTPSEVKSVVAAFLNGFLIPRLGKSFWLTPLRGGLSADRFNAASTFTISFYTTTRNTRVLCVSQGRSRLGHSRGPSMSKSFVLPKGLLESEDELRDRLEARLEEEQEGADLLTFERVADLVDKEKEWVWHRKATYFPTPVYSPLVRYPRTLFAGPRADRTLRSIPCVATCRTWAWASPAALSPPPASSSTEESVSKVKKHSSTSTQAFPSCWTTLETKLTSVSSSPFPATSSAHGICRIPR